MKNSHFRIDKSIGKNGNGSSTNISSLKAILSTIDINL
jgi:hypothetical protein